MRHPGSIFPPSFSPLLPLTDPPCPSNRPSFCLSESFSWKCFSECARPPVGLAPVDYRRAPSRSDPRLSSTISLLFSLSPVSSTLPASLIAAPFPVAHCLSPIPSHFFPACSSPVSGTLRQLEANGNKRDVRHTPPPPRTSPIFSEVE